MKDHEDDQKATRVDRQGVLSTDSYRREEPEMSDGH